MHQACLYTTARLFINCPNKTKWEIPGVTATETLISLEQSIKKEIPIRKELED